MEQQKEPSQQRPMEASCPECGTPRAADNTPSCACGTRASDAARDARTAQAAAAEDFDPLRIRPYVELDGTEGPQGPPGTADTTAPAAGGEAATATATATGEEAAKAAAGAATPDPDATMTLCAVDAAAGPGAVAEAGTGAGSAPGTESRTEPRTESEPLLSTPLAPSAGPPSAHDLRLFETSATAPLAPVTARTDGRGGAGGAADDGHTPRRRRRGALLSAAGAVVVVLGAAGFASGLFSYETPSRDGAMPDEVRAGVPDGPSSAEASPSDGPSAPSARPSASASPESSASASASARSSASPSPSVSASSASPVPSRSGEPTPTATPTATEQAPPESGDDDHDFYAGPELRRGDQGPEVVELQRRLAKANVYAGDADGRYDRQVEGSVRTYQLWRGIHSDESGVYGPDTRHRLESETGDL